MHPEYIKAGLRCRGFSLQDVAQELGVDKSMITKVVHRKAKSHRVASHIAALLDQPVQVVFPDDTTFDSLDKHRY